MEGIMLNAINDLCGRVLPMASKGHERGINCCQCADENVPLIFYHFRDCPCVRLRVGWGGRHQQKGISTRAQTPGGGGKFCICSLCIVRQLIGTCY